MRKTILSLAVFLALLVVSTALRRRPILNIPKELQVKPNYPGSQCSANDKAKTKSCLDAYFKTYGFDTSQGLPTYDNYRQVQNFFIMQYGNAGFDVFCDFESSLETCLGDLITSPCMNPDAFTTMYGDENTVETMRYATSFAEDVYECHNIELSKSIVACSAHAPTEDDYDCVHKLQAEAKNATDACALIDHFITCTEDFYVQFCGEDARSYFCNTEKIVVSFEMENCLNSIHQC